MGALAENRLCADRPMDPEGRCDVDSLMRSGRDAYRQFMRCNLKLVVSIAKKYTGHGLPLIDLIQNGNLGLDRAVKQFDYTRGLRFSTCAVWWIRQSIWQSLAGEARSIRIPVHTMEAISRLHRLDAQLTTYLRRAPAVAELAESARLRPSEVRRLLAADRRPLSLDLVDDGADSPAIREQIVDDDAASPEQLVEARMMMAAVRDGIRGLPDRERAVVCMRFGIDGRSPMTLVRVGVALGVSKQRVRQLERRALERLRTPELAAYLGGYVGTATAEPEELAAA
ncbi:sigma-70 family RNA polymerase sigma factor [Microbacterium panaciterrae]|uniref:sigma-70 family RNA polymerase sigma factor n=1 Tax=Microbacterium panaciterrae TaxID=985759 RepID=UPI0031EF65F4